MGCGYMYVCKGGAARRPTWRRSVGGRERSLLDDEDVRASPRTPARCARFRRRASETSAWRRSDHDAETSDASGVWVPPLDHIDRDPTNNGVANLRWVTHSQNLRNRWLFRTNTSGVRGVSFHRQTNRYAAYVRRDGKKVHLGYFETCAMAAQRVLEAETDCTT